MPILTNIQYSKGKVELSDIFNQMLFVFSYALSITSAKGCKSLKSTFLNRRAVRILNQGNLVRVYV